LMDIDEMQPVHGEVLVVGAGPVGMVAALALRARGRSVTVLEAEVEGRNRQGSRAIFVHKESLRLLEGIRPGLGRTIARQGLVWPVKRTFWARSQVFVRHYPIPDPDKLPPFTSLPQVEIERYLFEACKEAGVTFVWETPVCNVEVTTEGVRVAASNGQCWSAQYLIGADGAHSSVRHALGIEMAGSRSKNSYVVVDVAEDPAAPLPVERVFHYHHPGIGGRNVLFVPFVGGWRVDLQCYEHDDSAAFSGLDGVRSWLPQVMDQKYVDRITWVSTYQFLQVLAEHFTDERQRVLLVGEAAHLFAPFGARGMNSGVADAVSAAQAIDMALNAKEVTEAEQAIIEFAQTRRAAAEYNRAAAGQALAHVQKRSPTMWAKRHLAALLAPYWKRAGVWLDAGPYGPRSGPSGKASGKY
jgi:3-(3-hydroxy-phenyl)propionate hydroxylase